VLQHCASITLAQGVWWRLPNLETKNSYFEERALNGNPFLQIDATTDHIANNPCKFYRNLANITEYGTNKFTKYGASRPDGVSHHSFLLTTPDYSQIAFFSPRDAGNIAE
jgi:hypothetical protein